MIDDSLDNVINELSADIVAVLTKSRDEIDRLRAENDRLRVEKKELHTENDRLCAEIKELKLHPAIECSACDGYIFNYSGGLCRDCADAGNLNYI